MRVALLLLVAAAGLIACSSGGESASSTGSSSSSSSSSGTSGSGGGGGAPPIGGDRPVEVLVPSSLKPGVPAPLVILLHGYSVNGNVEELYLQLAPLAEERGFLYAHPDGTIDPKANYFWNATDACCDMFASGVDDSAYLASVIDQIQARYSVDPKRIYLVGHSNGGFMSYRMACDHADKIAAIASLAGAMFADPSKCKPSSPVSVLQIHGTSDPEVLYDGSMAENYPGAETTAKDWAALDSCAPDADGSAPALDLDDSIAGDETQVSRWTKGCASSTGVELWAIAGGHHVPSLTHEAHEKLIDFLFAHPKP
jgi:polyhydroxybutyrate depolymerase